MCGGQACRQGKLCGRCVRNDPGFQLEFMLNAMKCWNDTLTGLSPKRIKAFVLFVYFVAKTGK
jgi:hypothetical protein